MHFWSHFHLCVCLCLMKKMKRPVDLMNFAVRITTASRTTGDVTARMTVETTPMRSIAVSRSHLSEHSKAFSALVFVLNCFNCQETLCGTFRGQFHRTIWRFLFVCLFTICLFSSDLAHVAAKKDQLFMCVLCCHFLLSILSIWLFVVIMAWQTSKRTKNKNRRKKKSMQFDSPWWLETGGNLWYVNVL